MPKNIALTFFVLTVGLFIAQSSRATYQTLPKSESKTCPAQGEFFQDHFCWLGATANHQLKCVACPQPGGDFEDSRVIRGGQPSSAGVNALKNIGVRVIIDLRTDGEVGHGTEPKDAVTDGIAYFRLPMDTGGKGQEQKNEDALLRALGIVRFFLKENKTGLIYVHCERGEDRTGLTVAGIRLILEGRVRTDVRIEMTQHYFNTHYMALRNVWDRLRPEDSARIIDPSKEEQSTLLGLIDPP
jgi:hypothetical protein